MKVGILTYHFVINYGAVLQTYALNTHIKNNIKGAEVEVINFKINAIRFTDNLRILPISKNSKTIKSGLKTIKYRVDKKAKFERFYNTKLKLTKEYNTFSGLKKNPPQFDVYICGSDQVWNPFITFGNVAPYLFEFVNNPKALKTSYAASLGSSEIKEKYKPIFKKALKEFAKISVRENVGQAEVSKLTDKEVFQSIDPVFLLGQDDWKDIEEPISIKEDFILIYNMSRDEKQYEFAKKLKAETNCKIVEINRYGDADDCVDYPILDASPGEFITYFKEASYILTNSFHGTAFSLCFNKKFMSFARNKYNSRITSILEATGLSDKLYKEEMLNLDNLVKLLEYDTEVMNEKMKAEVDKSKKYIDSIFESFGE